MATLLRTPFFQAAYAPRLSAVSSSKSTTKPLRVAFKSSRTTSISTVSMPSSLSLQFSKSSSFRLAKFVPLAGETEITETEEVQEPEVQNSSDGAIDVDDDTETGDNVTTEKVSPSVISISLQLYREALANNDESQIKEIESYLKSMEDEKTNLEAKVASLEEELSVEKERILRISADFDNFRKRTERERLSLVTNAQGEVVESLLPVVDNFERAKDQIKVETEGEEKINRSYQSISKQFSEILSSLGVVPVETVGKPFDPLLHEAIMREESTEFEEGIILQEFRKGFKLGDRLLRPSMVKVSAGPGPTNSEDAAPSSGGQDESETTEGNPEANSS